MVRPSSQAPAILFPFGIFSRAFRRPDGGLLLRVLEALELSPDVGLLAWNRRPPHHHPRSQPSWAVPPTQPPRESGVSPPTTTSNNSPPRDAGLRQRLRHHLPPLPSTSISQAIPAGGADDASPLCEIRQWLPRPSGSDASQAATRGEGTKIRGFVTRIHPASPNKRLAGRAIINHLYSSSFLYHGVCTRAAWHQLEALETEWSQRLSLNPLLWFLDQELGLSTGYTGNMQLVRHSVPCILGFQNGPRAVEP